MTYDDIKLGVDVDDLAVGITDRQSGDPPLDKHV